MGNLGERAEFDEHCWICKISIAWDQIAKHKYSEILQEHLRLEKEVLLMARIGSDELLGRFDAYCPILVDVLEAHDKKKREEAEAAKPKEEIPSEEHICPVAKTERGQFRNAREEDLVVVQHVVEGLAQLVGHLLDLQLLAVDLVLDVVNPLVQLGDVHLSVLVPAFSRLELVLNAQDFVFELLFPLNSLLSRQFKLLHVLTNHLKLLLDSLQLALRQFSSLDRSLQLLLLNSQLPAQLVQLLLVVRRHLGRLSQVLVQLLKGDLVVHALTLHNLYFLQNVVGLLGGHGQLGDSVGQGGLSLLGLLLHQHDPPGEGGNVTLHLLVQLVLLLKLFVGLV